ncbi:MAG: hypothetical protein IPP32_11855 [Bacteroidetes bacterium]|nr:hypothetical protein [Bacteroidota bacterium]
MTRKIYIFFSLVLVLVNCSCKKCIRCSYDNNFGTRVTLQEYCGKSKNLTKYKDAYKDYKNFTCEEIK